jgi:hypothetical protein
VAQEQGGAAEQHEFHRNHLSAFLGASTHFHTDETAPTVGLDYTRRFSRRWGLGVLLDVALGEIERDVIVGVPILVYPWRELSIWVAPGFERASIDAREEGQPSTHETHSEFLVRFGAAYWFSLGGSLAFAPQINADVAGGHWTLVYGVAIGAGF